MASRLGREAVRMIADGGRSADIARAWIAEKGYSEEDLVELMDE